MAVSFAISVPIGAYHPLLRDCLKSLVIQSPRPKIAALDASNDPRVAEILDEFSDNIEYRRTGRDGGQSDAIIEGWKNTESDFLGWLNADDALYPGAMAIAARYFEGTPTTDLFYGNSVIIDDDNAIKGYHWAVEPPSENLLASGIISQPSCFFRREKYEEIGGLDRDLHYTMDWDLWVRFWRAGAKFEFSDEVLSRVLWSRDAKTGGFQPARRAELNRIIGANDSFGRRVRSRIGFTLHHFLEYLAPPVLAQAYRERAGKRANPIHGLDPAGGIKERAALSLVHYSEQPMTDLVFAVKGKKTRLMIAVGSSNIETNGAGEYTLTLCAPVQSGEPTLVRFENRGEETAHLLSAQWR